MKPTLHMLAGLLFITTSCSEKKNPDFEILNSPGIRFSHIESYMDGGTLGFFFETSKGDSFGVLLPPRLNNGYINVNDGSQTVQWVSSKEFKFNDAFNIERHSLINSKLIDVVEDTVQHEKRKVPKEYLIMLLNTLQTRNFSWKDYYDTIYPPNNSPAEP